MGGRHPKFYAEVDVTEKEMKPVHDLAMAHGLVVHVTPNRIGLSNQEQVDAIQTRFPQLKVHMAKAEPTPASKHHSPGFLMLVDDAKTRIKEISIQDTMKHLVTATAKEPVRFLDVREDGEWKDGHARGAEHLGRGVLERDIEQKVPDKGTRIIVYCGGGFRSALAADSLQKMGYTNVFSMTGGWKAWRDAGLPIES